MSVIRMLLHVSWEDRKKSPFKYLNPVSYNIVQTFLPGPSLLATRSATATMAPELGPASYPSYRASANM